MITKFELFCHTAQQKNKKYSTKIFKYTYNQTPNVYIAKTSTRYIITSVYIYNNL